MQQAEGRVTTRPVHYQKTHRDWPVCGERPISYDSTAVWDLVTCPKCRERQDEFTLKHEIFLPPGHPLLKP